MVYLNRGFPDPDNPNDELAPSNDIIVGTDTDSDFDGNDYDGYEPIPMNDYNLHTSDDDEGAVEQEQEIADEQTSMSLPSVTRMEDILVKETWAGPAPKEVDIVMDSNKVDEVKLAMQNITLPSSCIPEWASNIPEEQWKQELLHRLQNREKVDKM